MKYRLTFNAPEENLKRLKDKGCYPFSFGGVNWEQGTEVLVTDLSPFYEGERAKRELHPFLKAEEIKESHEASEATDRYC